MAVTGQLSSLLSTVAIIVAAKLQACNAKPPLCMYRHVGTAEAAASYSISEWILAYRIPATMTNPSVATDLMPDAMACLFIIHCHVTVALAELMPSGPSSSNLFAYILHTASVLAAAQPVCCCLQVWNAQDAQEEVLVMVVRWLSNVPSLCVAVTSSACGTKRNQLQFT